MKAQTKEARELLKAARAIGKPVGEIVDVTAKVRGLTPTEALELRRAANAVEHRDVYDRVRRENPILAARFGLTRPDVFEVDPDDEGGPSAA